MPPPQDDWDPRDPEVLRDQIAAYDALRGRCPVAHSAYLQWSLLRHADVLRVVEDPARFGNAVSTHPSVPNGMDPPEHTGWRALIEPYFAQAELDAFAPRAVAVAHALVQGLPTAGEVDWMADFADECAVRLLCAFMGWDEEVHEPLRLWARDNQAATLAGDRERMAAVAYAFDGQIRAQLQRRREAGAAAADITSRLMRERIEGRAVTDEELVSIIRNWTVGELSTLAASLGILAHYLAHHPQLQEQLRASPQQLGPAIDEILRIHPPLIANRRLVRENATVAGRAFAPGDRLTLLWASANRDEAVFGDPDRYDPERNAPHNLLYGAGIHVCPGAGLSRLQLRLVLAAVLEGTRAIAPAAGAAPVRARYPASGFAQLPLQVTR